MKRTSAIAHFRQLCCLGLGAQAVMPSLLSAMHELIPSETNGFFWADESGHLAGFMPEYVIPEVVATLVDNFDRLVKRTLPVNFAATMLRGRPVGNLLPVFDQDSSRGDLYHVIYRPYNMHHAIDGSCAMRRMAWEWAPSWWAARPDRLSSARRSRTR